MRATVYHGLKDVRVRVQYAARISIFIEATFH